MKSIALIAMGLSFVAWEVALPAPAGATSEPPICVSARNARARNSPAAPALERQCQTAMQADKSGIPLSKVQRSSGPVAGRAPDPLERARRSVPLPSDDFGDEEVGSQYNERRRVEGSAMSQSSSERTIEPSVISNGIEFSPEAKLSRRMEFLEERIDQLLRQNAEIHTQLIAANKGISKNEQYILTIDKQMRSPTGRTMINLVSSIWAKVEGL